MNTSSSILFVILIFAGMTKVFGQEIASSAEETKYILTIVGDKSEYIGVLENGTKDSIYIKVDDELHSFHLNEVSTLIKYDYKGPFQNYERSAERHVLAPSGLTLKKDEAYYQNLLLFGSVFGVGVTDRFSMTGGVFLPSITYEELVAYFAPKFSFKMMSNLHVGFGVVGGFDIDTHDFDLYEFMLVPFINTSIGNADHNFTIGLGYGVEDEDLDNRVTAGMFGFKVRFSEKFSVVSENTLVLVDNHYSSRSENWFFGSHVLRHVNAKGSFDFGALTIYAYGDPIFLPYIGYARFF